MHQLEPLLSPQDLADFLEVPIATIYAWRYRGEGPPGFRVGRHLRYRRSDVEQWIRQQLEAAPNRVHSRSGVITTPAPGGARE